MPKYDIFISYRREGGAQYARTLQLMLEKKRFKVFLDYDELRDSKFSPAIEAAIKSSKIFIIILSKGALSKCSTEGNWIAKEIRLAIASGCKIIPVNPDGTFDGIPSDLPDDIKKEIEETQHSYISFGSMLNASVDMMIKDRIKRETSHGFSLKLASIIIASIILAGSFGLIFCKYAFNQANVHDVELQDGENNLSGIFYFDGAQYGFTISLNLDKKTNVLNNAFYKPDGYLKPAEIEQAIISDSSLVFSGLTFNTELYINAIKTAPDTFEGKMVRGKNNGSCRISINNN